MACSIESRVPFLIPELLEYLRRLPDDYLIDDQGVTKSVFRAAMRGLVPDLVLDRREKLGFETPEREWVVGGSGWIDGLLSDPWNEQVKIVDVGALKEAILAIRKGRRPYHESVWRTLNLLAWARHFRVAFGGTTGATTESTPGGSLR
jgi:asparagine synthase (glutamine-hydrolysing)